MALVQEMAVKIDQGFLGAILALFTPATDPQADRQKVGRCCKFNSANPSAHIGLMSTMFVFQSQLLERDLQLLQTELMEASLTDTSGLSFFEHFHISPIKVTRCSVFTLLL